MQVPVSLSYLEGASVFEVVFVHFTYRLRANLPVSYSAIDLETFKAGNVDHAVYDGVGHVNSSWAKLAS